jgi:iron(III) transport system permease protein
VVIVSTALPVAVLMGRALPLRSFAEVWQTAKEEIATSLAVSAVSATLLLALALPMAYFSRSRARLGRFYASSLVPFMISGPMVGLGLIALWNRPGPMGLVYDSLFIVVLACIARFLFFAHQGLTGAFRDLHPCLEEAAVAAGAPWWRHVTGIFIPLLRPTLVALWGLGFIFSFRELDAAVLVTPPGRTPLPVRLFTLMHYGPSRLVAALSVLTVAVILGGGIATMTVYNRWRRLLIERG